MSDSDNEKKIKLSTLVYAMLTVLFVIIAIISTLAYGTNTEIGKRIYLKISKIVPIPAAVIGWNDFVLLSDVRSNLASVEKFYKVNDFSQEGLRVDFSTESGKKRLKIKEREILEKLIEDKVIKILAQKRGISISEKDIDKIVENKLEELGTASDLEKDLANTYGWNMEDFKKNVVIPTAYKDALMQYVLLGELDNSSAKEKANEARKELESGKDFAEVVDKFSEGDSKKKGGELGWVKKEQMIQELQEALFDEERYGNNEVIESSIGFHIVRIEEKKKEGEESVLRLKQIFVAKKTFADWLKDSKKSISILIPLKDFRWNSDRAVVEFRSEKMQKFEAEERLKAQGDASIMF